MTCYQEVTENAFGELGLRINKNRTGTDGKDISCYQVVINNTLKIHIAYKTVNLCFRKK